MNTSFFGTGFVAATTASFNSFNMYTICHTPVDSHTQNVGDLRGYFQFLTSLAAKISKSDVSISINGPRGSDHCPMTKYADHCFISIS